MSNGPEEKKESDTSIFTDKMIAQHWKTARSAATRWEKTASAEPTLEKKRQFLLKSRFTISKGYLKRLGERQKGRCRYTQVKLGNGVLYKPSLVRRNPKRGWVQGNVAWAIYPIAVAKRHWPDDAFFGIAKRIAETANDRRYQRLSMRKIRKDSDLIQGPKNSF